MNEVAWLLNAMMLLCSQVGERGVTLSGGQKARLSLARAVYSKRDVYLLDDPLSAVDVRVAKSIFQKCILGLLRDKTVVLVTHQTQFLPEVDTILILQGTGVVAGYGTFDELRDNPVLMHITTAANAPVLLTPTTIALVSGDPNVERATLMTAENTTTGALETRTFFEYIMSAGGRIWVTVLAALCAVSTATGVRTLLHV